VTSHLIAYTGLAELSATEWWAAGIGMIIHTPDAGAHWDTCSTINGGNPRDLCFPTPFVGYAADNTTIWRYTSPSSPAVQSMVATNQPVVTLSWPDFPEATWYEYKIDGQPYSGTAIAPSLELNGMMVAYNGQSKTVHVRTCVSPGYYSDWMTAMATVKVGAPDAPQPSAPLTVTTPSVTVSWPAVSSAAGYAYRLAGSSALATDGLSAIVDGLHVGANQIGVRSDYGPYSSAWTTITVTYTAPVRTAIAITRSPSKSSATFKRKKGVAKFTLKATVSSAGRPVVGTIVWLQTSSNGKKWKNAYKLTSTSAGLVSKKLSVKKRSTAYYRWIAPESPIHLSGSSTKFRVIVK
jgi:hypothetical protein